VLADELAVADALGELELPVLEWLVLDGLEELDRDVELLVDEPDEALYSPA
jgi:hypothetical protein